MNTRNIQTFLMVSAAFFAMSAPVRSNAGSTSALSNAISRAAQVAPVRLARSQSERSVRAD
ncbi:hypothetical protein GXB81_16910 [Paraburkholderia sp. Ac-20336]|uniref:hypothetical protein n=1 Tax=Burkholderiaceae TaxID=119060 RepID=UPI00141DC2EB|nr:MULTISPECIES: hypothetical protein [Burkholderiaceae]MBN3804715.1 hypothetical protein [Paraburkholderia sp. Ac-20336]MBN3849278.1 hypothetical protein [Paraburkholderia sp. Ac-20342]NIF55291.1 hypothetical protein [Burkholderia sp. Ax-1724]NIF79934.1 hypothetical protein [Paraburkholderia sp. Cy-641]